MTVSAIKTQTVHVRSGDVTLPCYLAQPDVDSQSTQSFPGIFPGIIVIQEIFGVNEHIRDVTERIAKEGYVAIAPPIYQRQAPGFEVGYTAEDVKIGRVYKEKNKATELLQDVQAAADYLKSLPQVKSGGLGSIGFCFGGHVVYLTATLPDIQATASFYGAGIPTWQPGEEEPTVSRTKDISGTIYAFFGNEDGSIPPEHVEEIEQAFNQYNIDHKIFRYDGAEHGFFCDRRASYNAKAAAAAWEQVKQLFATL